MFGKHASLAPSKNASPDVSLRLQGSDASDARQLMHLANRYPGT